MFFPYQFYTQDFGDFPISERYNGLTFLLHHHLANSSRHLYEYQKLGNLLYLKFLQNGFQGQFLNLFDKVLNNLMKLDKLINIKKI